jgi:hypothetical protein
MSTHLLIVTTHLLIVPVFFVDYGNKFDDYANMLDDWVNIVAHSTNVFDISSLDIWIPNPSLLQLLFMDLLFIYRSKINIVFIVGSLICSSSLTFFICGFYTS